MDHNAPGCFPASSLAEALLGFVSLHWLLSVSWVLFLTNMFFFCYDLFKVKFMKHCMILFAVIYW